MKDLVELVVRRLVDNPDAVQIGEENDGRDLVFTVEVDQADRGHVIGRNGSTVNALRTLLNGLAQRSRQRVELEVLD